jgi:hypothetical protein
MRFGHRNAARRAARQPHAKIFQRSCHYHLESRADCPELVARRVPSAAQPVNGVFSSVPLYVRNGRLPEHPARAHRRTPAMRRSHRGKFIAAAAVNGKPPLLIS